MHAVKNFIFFASALALCALSTRLHAADSAYLQSLARAGEWLAAAQDADGSWGADEALKSLLTSESVLALQGAAQVNGAGRAGITWLENHHHDQHDYTARRIAALAAHGDDVSAPAARLMDGQRSTAPGNQGWGLSPAYQGSVIETALSVNALGPALQADRLGAALAWLAAAQAPDGDRGWAAIDGQTDDPAVTALVIRMLHGLADPALQSAIDDAAAALPGQVAPAAPALLRAHASLALLTHDTASTAGLALLDSLVTDQGPAGDWDGDIHATALAMQALSVAAGFVAAGLGDPVYIIDANLRAAINRQLGRNAADGINYAEMSRLEDLQAADAGIYDLTGLEAAVNLATADLSGNLITDLAPLTGLANLEQADLAGNPLSTLADADGDGYSDRAELDLPGADPLDQLVTPDSDLDEDGFSPALGDIDDRDATVYPGAPEICGDGIDQDGDGLDGLCATGDLNADGRLDAADVLLLNRIILSTYSPVIEQQLQADLYPEYAGDGVIDLSDLLVMWKRINDGAMPP